MFADAKLQAGGDINVSRFVKVSTAADQTVLQAAAATDIVIGISQDGAKAAPIPGATTLAAEAGDQLRYFPAGGAPCLLTAGAGGVARGAEISSDATGQGVAGGGVGEYVGAIGLETAAAGERAHVLPVLYKT